MKIKCAFIPLLLVLLLATGCTKNGRLYNLTTGEVTAVQYSYSGSGHGRISGVMAGETLTGEYVTVANSSTSWGSIYGNVYGTGGSASGTATRTSFAVEGKQRGSAIVTGNKGTIINCEYVTSALSGSGSGACEDNHGTKYKLMF